MLLELDSADRGRDVETGEVYHREGGVWRSEASRHAPEVIYERDRARIAAELGIPYPQPVTIARLRGGQ